MLLMFVGGVMNLAWMAVLALYFLAEKLVPWPQAFSRITGVIQMVGGLLMGTLY
jgi:predicted metal-binding membrane protein